MKGFHTAVLGSIVCAALLVGGDAANAVPTQGRSTQHVLLHDAIERTYSVYVPPGVKRSRHVPLLVALHGGGGSAAKWPQYTNNGFERLADRERFILVYPNGLEGHWNDGRGVARFYSQREEVDDSGFLAALIDHLAKSYPIDAKRVYVTGASNGGMMAHRLAAEHSDKVTAIAAVISSIPKNLEGKLHPTHPVSVLVMNGTEDRLVRWNGGAVAFGNKTNGYVVSTDDTVGFWARHNRCADTVKVDDLTDVAPNDGTTVTRTRYVNCKSESEVVLYQIVGGGHTWPARQDKRGLVGTMLLDKVVGRKSRDIDACEVIWRFFEHHPRR